MTKWRRRYLKLTSALTLALGFNSSTPAVPSQAESNNRIQAATRIEFVLPPKGAPGRRNGTGTRAPICSKPEKPLTALVPPTNIGLTISSRPTFWFYIPYQPSDKNPVEFELREGNKKTVYKKTFQLKNTPGVIGINLPQNVPPLEINKKYRWFFSVICNPANRTEDDAVNGYVERVALNSEVKSQLEAAKTERDRIILYAKNGLWHETITKLAEMRRANPQDNTLKTDWTDLLTSDPIDLNNIVTEPILPPPF